MLPTKYMLDGFISYYRLLYSYQKKQDMPTAKYHSRHARHHPRHAGHHPRHARHHGHSAGRALTVAVAPGSPQKCKPFFMSQGNCAIQKGEPFVSTKAPKP